MTTKSSKWLGKARIAHYIQVLLATHMELAGCNLKYCRFQSAMYTHADIVLGLCVGSAMAFERCSRKILKLLAMSLIAGACGMSHAIACVRVGLSYSGGHMIVNGCLKSVIVSYKGSRGSWGSTGRLGPQKEVPISADKDEYITLEYCDYKQWT